MKKVIKKLSLALAFLSLSGCGYFPAEVSLRKIGQVNYQSGLMVEYFYFRYSGNECFSAITSSQSSSFGSVTLSCK